MRRRFWIIIFLSVGTFAYASYQPIPTRIQGVDKKIPVVDDETIDKQDEIIYQLKILNEYMSRISGEEITKSDIE